MKDPLVREVGQSFYLMFLAGGVMGASLGLGLFVARVRVKALPRPGSPSHRPVLVDEVVQLPRTAARPSSTARSARAGTRRRSSGRGPVA